MFKICHRFTPVPNPNCCVCVLNDPLPLAWREKYADLKYADLKYAYYTSVDVAPPSMRDLNPAMARAAFPLFSNHFPERMSQIVLLDAPVIFSGINRAFTEP